MTPLVECFGVAVRQMRRSRGWSQERLAERSDLNRSYVGEIERGHAIASLVTIEKIARALELAPSQLLLHGETVSRRSAARWSGLAA